MNRAQQRVLNANTIEHTYRITRGKRNCSYKFVVRALNNDGYCTSRGNHWTPKRLFRMLQREGVSGLHGLMKINEQELALKKLGYFKTP